MQRFSKLFFVTIISFLIFFSCDNGSNQLNPNITKIQPESALETAETILGKYISSNPTDYTVIFNEKSALANSTIQVKICQMGD